MSRSDHMDALTQVVVNNLANQHDWTGIAVHTQAGLPRPLLYGLPPKRLYVHPDEQIETIKAEKDRPDRIRQLPEQEWVLPLHLSEKWSPARFAQVFDAIHPVPPGRDPVTDEDDDDTAGSGGDRDAPWKLWRGPKRGKRLLLATVQDDSTVAYYWIHDGLVKPRQN
ncbi:tRNA-splicing endonuclease subunit Sen15 [Lasiosphaeria miniovina]|uniref:tRNA-splicing endonuclease subunit Sen15 n=1 Tax=Lasiosphaeria miniovina TaxID=1954250 RepID=A0AA40AVQ2_9PEZI|nr:tRNA-splicing endonuclease subunit Sen15 [Lasiosphaeria miniovina]KAK0722829.1 tRNA-splicing endonuclease subunit Sen15 [Lasiosphaeria miniovina]